MPLLFYAVDGGKNHFIFCSTAHSEYSEIQRFAVGGMPNAPLKNERIFSGYGGQTENGRNHRNGCA
jgi:hypothetical protein